VKDLYMDVLGMRISQVMIRNLFLQEFVLSWVAWKSWVESVVSSMEVIQRAAVFAL
jgi:hypothetical protein